MRPAARATTVVANPLYWKNKMPDCWSSVTVYGPSAEITRFRRFYIGLPPGSDPQNVAGGWDGYEAYIVFNGVMPAELGRCSHQAEDGYALNYREDAPELCNWNLPSIPLVNFPRCIP